MAKPSIIALLTDFGSSDTYVAQLKAVILSIAPEAVLVDVTHGIAPGDVLAGAFALRQALPYFPPGTVHCVVVDPGVGTERRIIAARFAAQAVVCPDNGLISFVSQDLPMQEIAVVRDERYFLTPAVSATFHGRDIMAPVAAHVARGLALSRLGPRPERIKMLDIPQARVEADGMIVGQVVSVDHFGNLISNIPARMLAETGAATPAAAALLANLPAFQLAAAIAPVEVLCNGRPLGLLQATYAAVSPGEPVAVVNGAGVVEVAVNLGRAKDVLSASVGSEIRIVRKR